VKGRVEGRFKGRFKGRIEKSKRRGSPCLQKPLRVKVDY